MNDGGIHSSADPSHFRNPARHFSVEQLQKIFWFYVNPHPGEDTGLYVVPTPTYGPFILAQLNSDLRKLALGTPRLWNSIHISHARPKPTLDMINMWLKYSDKLKLYIHLDAGIRQSLYFKAVLDIFVAHIDRWHDVSFVLACNSMQQLEHLDQALHLRNLTIDWHWSIEDPLTLYPKACREVLRHCLSAAPNLQCLSWRPIWMVGSLSSTYASTSPSVWHKLLSVKLRRVYSMDECLFILAECINIREFCLDGVNSSFLFPTFLDCGKTVPLMVPRLERLLIRDTSVDVTPLFDRLTLPLLRQFSFNFFVDSSEIEAPAIWSLEEMLVRSGPLKMNCLRVMVHKDYSGTAVDKLKCMCRRLSLPDIDILRAQRTEKAKPRALDLIGDC